MKPLLYRALRSVHRLVKRVDRADPPVLRYVPRRWKRSWVSAVFRRTAALAGRGSPNLRLSAPENRHYLDVLAGDHEPEVLALLERKLLSGMRVLDVGANIGYFTVHMARLVGPAGRVWALEPSPENLLHLLENVRRHCEGQVRVLAAAAGRERRMASLYPHPDSRRSGLYSGSDTALEVPVLALDEVLAAESLDLVKIDTEGADLEVLQGMEGLLQANPRIRIIVEWHPEHLKAAGEDPDDLLTFLEDRGFQLFTVEKDGTYSRFRSSTFAGSYVNLYAIHPSEEGAGVSGLLDR